MGRLSGILALILVVTTFAACISGYEITAYDNQLGSKIGPKECAKGSSYWCQDLQTAKKCGAVKHCIQVVWELKKLPADNSDICETCKKMVQEARDELMSNTTQELIKEVLEGTCHIYFPIKVIANECVQLVDEFIPELIDMLASRMDPQMVCAVAWLCNSDKMKQLVEDVRIVEETPKEITLGDSCQDCKNFVVDAIDTVNKMGKDALKEKLLQVCSQMHGYMKEGCEMAISSNLDKIYTYITTQLKPDEFCAFAAMCVDGLDPVKKSTFKVRLQNSNSDDPECDFCVQLITRLKDIVTANSTKAEVHQVLVDLCKQTGSFQEKCVDYVNQYFDLIYQFITSEMDPKMLCKEMDLCPNQSKFRLTHKKPFIAGNDEKASYGNSVNWQKPPVENSINKDAVIVKVPLSKPFAYRPRPSPTNCDLRGHADPQCVICEFVLSQLQNMLKDNKTEEEIKHAIEKVCSYLPKSVSKQCNGFVEQYGSAILALLAEEVDPSLVCTEVGLCSQLANLMAIKESPVKTMARLSFPTKPEEMQLPLDRMFRPSQRFDDKESCLLCQYSMKLLHMLINMNGTKESIILGIDNICHKLPVAWKNRCHDFIDEYAEPILDMMQQQNLSEVCGILSFCQGNFAANMLVHASAAAQAANSHVNSDSCEICTATIEMLAKLLANPDVEKDIVKTLEKVCAYVPEKMQQQCQGIIDAYGIYAIQLIAELADAKQVCQAVALCANAPGQVHLLGGNKCTYGPSYWCQSKIHARACKAELHCKQFVWKN